MYYLRSRAEQVNDVIVEWETLGSRVDSAASGPKDETTGPDDLR